jgi:hypothetical protein
VDRWRASRRWKRFIARSDEKLTASLELEAAIRAAHMRSGWHSAAPAKRLVPNFPRYISPDFPQ